VIQAAASSKAHKITPTLEYDLDPSILEA
jgi:hypothetical protein